MLEYNQITQRKYIVFEDEPYEVLTSQISKKSRQKASNQSKLKNIKNGKVIDKTFHQSDAVEEAEIDKKSITYLYEKRGEFWFCEEGNPKERFFLTEDALGGSRQYLKEQTTVDALTFNDEVIGLKLPVKMEFEVKEAPPGIKGNTAQGGSKQVVVETGAVFTVPLFINQGDTIRVNTETGEYVERATKG